MAEKQRSVAEIRAELARNRAQVADSIGGLVDDMKPRNIAKRTVNDAKGFVSDEFQNVKAQVKDENGWRTDRLLVIGGAVLGLVAFFVTTRAIANKRTRSVEARVRKALESPRAQR